MNMIILHGTDLGGRRSAHFVGKDGRKVGELLKGTNLFAFLMMQFHVHIGTGVRVGNTDVLIWLVVIPCTYDKQQTNFADQRSLRKDSSVCVYWG